jgi:non-specific serine/threonine protein kinase
MNEHTVQPWHDPINERERQILSLISEGFSNREIGFKLSLSPDTIKWYNKQLYSKLGVRSRTQAIALARERGLLHPLHSQSVQEYLKQNLPIIPTSFIGRQNEITEVKQLLRTTRLLVLTGIGGSGKTRLALQIATEIAADFPDGARLVELAPISDPALVPNAIADALGVSQRGETALLSKILHFLQHKRLLLILDNFEHLLVAAPLIGKILASAPQIIIIATSREKLHVYGEKEYPVQPLALPNPEQVVSNEQLMYCEAAMLFVDRAKLVKKDFRLHPGEAAIVARICVYLDGLPLALELAASWVKLFSIEALERRLVDRLSLLTGGAHNLNERQRTLRDTIDWSYNLLNDAESLLFVRLSVFRGGCTLDAIEHICGQDLPGNLLSILSSLVDKSLVRGREGIDGEMRFEMLETIRAYALERLSTEHNANNLNGLHANYYASLAEIAAVELRGSNQRNWFARVRNDYDNLRTVLAWSLNSSEIEPGMRITTALRDYWFYTGSQSEYQYWTDLALERVTYAPPSQQAGVLVSAGLRNVMMKDPGKGKQHILQAISLYRQLGDERNAAWASMFLSTLLSRQPADYHEKISLCQESLEIFRRLGDLPGQAQALNILGEYARVQLDLEVSKHYYEQCLELVAQTGERLREGMLKGNLGFIAYRQGSPRQALQFMREFYQIMNEFRNEYWSLIAVSAMSGPLAALGHPELAARLLDSAKTQLEMMGSGFQPTDVPEIEEYRRAITEQLGEAGFSAAWVNGSRMTIQQILELTHEIVPSPLNFAEYNQYLK